MIHVAGLVNLTYFKPLSYNFINYDNCYFSFY